MHTEHGPDSNRIFLFNYLRNLEVRACVHVDVTFRKISSSLVLAMNSSVDESDCNSTANSDFSSISTSTSSCEIEGIVAACLLQRANKLCFLRVILMRYTIPSRFFNTMINWMGDNHSRVL